MWGMDDTARYVRVAVGEKEADSTSFLNVTLCVCVSHGQDTCNDERMARVQAF